MTAASGFMDQLATAVQRCGNPVVVGLDPRKEHLPSGLLPESWYDEVGAVAEAYRMFCYGVVDVVADQVPAVKIQAAFFEQLGPAGTRVMRKITRYAQEAGLLVVLDAKRNDIGSTAQAYADAYLGRETSVWGGDALTISPYLGDDSLQPFIETAQARHAGLFVLVKTSNPGGKMLQDLEANGQCIYQHMGQYVESVAAATQGTAGYGVAGAVVGATYPEQLAELRAAMPHTWFLVPGYGSQGGTAADVRHAFDDQGLGAIVNSSRAIIFAHAREEYAGRYGDKRWQDAVRAATKAMIADLTT
ncbi:MAG: orotidine-5'-phosphate decarboxylase [Planctomycetota bacterium]